MMEGQPGWGGGLETVRNTCPPLSKASGTLLVGQCLEPQEGGRTYLEYSRREHVVQGFYIQQPRRTQGILFS